MINHDLFLSLSAFPLERGSGGNMNTLIDNKKIVLALVAGVLTFLPQASFAAFGDVTTYVGQIIGGDSQDQTESQFDKPEDMTLGGDGVWYIADTYNHAIRTIGTDGVVRTAAGTGAYGFANGATGSATFAYPKAVVRDSGGALYVTDYTNDAIRKIQSGTVSTLVSGLDGPHGLAISGSTLYFTNSTGGTVQKVSTSGTGLTTLASGLQMPTEIIVSGNDLYVSETHRHRVIKVDATNGAVTLIAGSGENAYEEGVGENASFMNIGGMTKSGNMLYVTDNDGFFDQLSEIDLATNTVSLIRDDPQMITMNSSSDLEMRGSMIRILNGGSSQMYEVDPTTPEESTFIAGGDRFGNVNGEKSVALIGRPKDMVLSPDGATMYLAENNKIRSINPRTAEVSALIGNSVDNYQEARTGTNARFSDVSSIDINSAGDTLYVTDRNNHRIRGITIATQTDFLITGAGNTNDDGQTANGYQEGAKCLNAFTTGVSGCAYFDNPSGLVISPNDQYLYVADTANNRIRRVTIATGETSLIAGSGTAGYKDAAGSSAQFSRPFGVDITSDGKTLYVADSRNHVIRAIDLTSNTVTTLAGSGSSGYLDSTGSLAYFNTPEYVEIVGDKLYVSEAGSQRLRQIELSARLTKTVAGNGVETFKNGNGVNASFNNPKGIVAHGTTLYVADMFNDLIRSVDIAGTAPFTEKTPDVTATDPYKLEVWGYGPETKMVSVKGSNFRHGAEVRFGSYDVVKAFVATDGKSISVELPFKKMVAGYYDVRVTNSDSQSDTLVKGFEVMQNGVTPSTHYTNNVEGEDLSVREASSTFFALNQSLRGGYFPAVGDLTPDTGDEIVIGAGSGMGPQVQVWTESGTLRTSFFAYDKSVTPGVRTAVCDLEGDGTREIVTIAGPGGRPHVRVFNGEGKAISPGFFALDGKFTKGAYIACGDVNGDGKDEMLIAADASGGPHVTVHNKDGGVIANFFAYDAGFRRGIRVATADLFGDGVEEIITVPATGADAHVQIFGIVPGSVKRLTLGFYPFATSAGVGASIASGDMDGDGQDEIVIGIGTQSTNPVVRVMNMSGDVLDEFLAYGKGFTGGVNLASGDVNNDSIDELITTPAELGSPQVRVMNGEL